MADEAHNSLSRAITPIDRVGVTELVVQRIKEMLADGTLRAGSRLPAERELAEMLRISRPSLRTALKALSVMGVISAKPGAGTFIAEALPEVLNQPLHFMTLIHNTEIKEIFEARRIVEAGLAEIAAERISAAQLAILAAEIAAMRETVNDLNEFITHDMRFHQTIAVAADNHLMSGIMETLLQLLFRFRDQKIRSVAALQKAVQWHQRIYQALERRDGKRAKELMSGHLRASEQDWKPLRSRPRPEASDGDGSS